ncbi:hypothetical protein ABE28_015050 [Peribacillus muralis]|uniref:Transposase DDE domain-containing protein n=1 Tax=Peribacillus muralis TaxID=264697 RepID=A0A1B3XR05_9BACI|nr:hypothetical protein ABE28_015050 [Peribacillus muralis]
MDAYFSYTDVMIRHIRQTHMEGADHLHLHQDEKTIYAKRKETIERTFADSNEKHDMQGT